MNSYSLVLFLGSMLTWMLVSVDQHYYSRLSAEELINKTSQDYLLEGVVRYARYSYKKEGVRLGTVKVNTPVRAQLFFFSKDDHVFCRIRSGEVDTTIGVT